MPASRLSATTAPGMPCPSILWREEAALWPARITGGPSQNGALIRPVGLLKQPRPVRICKLPHSRNSSTTPSCGLRSPVNLAYSARNRSAAVRIRPTAKTRSANASNIAPPRTTGREPVSRLRRAAHGRFWRHPNKSSRVEPLDKEHLRLAARRTEEGSNVARQSQRSTRLPAKDMRS